MAAPLYKPPTRVTTIQIPFLAIVNRADPSREKFKHRDVEYEFSGKVKVSDPYHTGPYAQPLKRVSTTYVGSVTFAQGDITGVGKDWVYLTNAGAAGAPAAITTRTAAQMFLDIAGSIPGLDYNLRIINLGGGADIAIVPGAGVALVGNPNISNARFTDFEVYFTDASDAIMTVMTANNPYNSSPH